MPGGATSPHLFGRLLYVRSLRGPSRGGCANHFFRRTRSNALTKRRERLEEKLLRDPQDQILKPEVVDFTIAEFGRQLRAELRNAISRSPGSVALARAEFLKSSVLLRVLDQFAAGRCALGDGICKTWDNRVLQTLLYRRLLYG